MSEIQIGSKVWVVGGHMGSVEGLETIDGQAWARVRLHRSTPSREEVTVVAVSQLRTASVEDEEDAKDHAAWADLSYRSLRRWFEAEAE